MTTVHLHHYCRLRTGAAPHPRATVLAVALAVTLALVAAPAPADAAGISVPGDYATIQQAIDAASPGDTITVGPGRYVGGIDYHGKDVALLSTGGPTVTVIDGDDGTGVDMGPGGSLVGFTITGSRASFGAGMDVHGSGSMIQGNIFDGNVQTAGGFGAAIGGNAASPTIDGNLFTNHSCDLQWNSGVVSFVNDSSPVISNNVFANNQCRALNIGLPSGNNPIVVNNLMVDNPAGIHLDRRTDTSTHVYRNNLILNNTVGLEVVFGSEANNPVWEHNLVFGNGANYSGISDRTGTAGNISVDPGLHHDLRPCPAMPPVDAGAAASGPPIDFDGVARPQNGLFDIGAFELVPPVGSATPMAVDDGPYFIWSGEALTVAPMGVLGNDADANCDTLTAAKVSDPAHGTLTLASDGSFVYAHDGSGIGTDSFTYRVSDGGLTSAPATVTIFVEPNTPPTAVDDGPFATAQGTTETFSGLLGNDSDPEGTPLTAVKVTDPAHGTVTVNPDGTFTYAHDGSWTDTDSFTYAASDGALQSPPATVTLLVNLGGAQGNGAVRGTVTSAGQPVEGICTWLGTRGGGGEYTKWAEGETAADGTYLIEVTPGAYELFFWDCSAGLIEFEYFNDQTSYRGANPVVVNTGMVANANADLRDGWAIAGRVTDEASGAPLAGIVVTAGIDGVVVGVGETDALGNYTIDGLRRGNSYTLLFQDPTFEYFDEFYDDQGDIGSAAKVGVSTEIVSGIDAGLQKDRPFVDLGLVDPGTGLWQMTDVIGDRAPVTFYYGNPGDFPIVGDWDCDGDETPGLYRQSDGYVYLRNSNSVGVADVKFFFGNPGDIPLAGDFNGNGCDTVSIYRPAEGRVFIINKLGSGDTGLGAADTNYYFGNPGDKPFVGDFDGDGVETVGLHRESTGLVYFNNEHRSQAADNQFIYGDPGDRLVCGDWNVDGMDSPAVFRPVDTTFYLRFTNTAGVADVDLEWGESDWLPIAGVFWPDPAAPKVRGAPHAAIGHPIQGAQARR